MRKVKKNFLFIPQLALIQLLFLPGQAMAKFVGPKETSDDGAAPAAGEIFDFEIIDKIVTFLFAIVFIASLIGFLFAGIKFITAGGSEGSLEAAHNAWRASLIGLALSLIGYIMFSIFKFIFIN